MKREEFAEISKEKMQNINYDILIENLNNDLLQIILAVIQDGICILDRELNILYANPVMYGWYSNIKPTQIQKCYNVFHGRDTPCAICPTLRALENKRPESEVVPYLLNNNIKGWQQIYATPILDGNGEVTMVIEYVKDITNQRKAEHTLEFIESQNNMLTDFLDQKQKEKEELSQIIVTNVELSLKPILNYLDKLVGKENTDIVRRQVDASIKGLTSRNSSRISLLSPKELQVAYLIRDDYLSKEIADRLVVSKKTVDYHRTNIRKKLNLSATENLQSFLERNL